MEMRHGPCHGRPLLVTLDQCSESNAHHRKIGLHCALGRCLVILKVYNSLLEFWKRLLVLNNIELEYLYMTWS